MQKVISINEFEKTVNSIVKKTTVNGKVYF